MSQHEKFEAAWRKEYPLHGATTFKRSGFNPDAYVNTRVHDGWLMWQASCRAALEEAIQIIETHRVPIGNSSAGEMAAGWTMDALHEIRDSIRALAKETNNG
ncbi:UNVERIFIED_ORG: hypothetical protein ABIC54_004415 [Burkholderia sp. 1263]